MRGAALPMVVLSLGLVAALSVGGAFVTRQFESNTRLADEAARLEPAAEGALALAASQLDTAAFAIPVGRSVALPEADAGTTGHPVTFAWITRLSDSVFALTSEASLQRKTLLRKRLRLYVTADSAGFRPLAQGAWTRLP